MVTGEGLSLPCGGGRREQLRLLLVERRGAVRARTAAFNQLSALVVTAVALMPADHPLSSRKKIRLSDCVGHPVALAERSSDCAESVTGSEIPASSVYADGSAIETPWLEQYGDVDVAAAVLRLAGGGLVILSGTRHDPLGYDVRLEVFGTKDSLVAGLDERTPLAGRPGPAYRDFWDRFEPAYRAELETFVRSIRTGGKSACSLEEARSALRAAVAADRSLAEHRPVALAKAPPDG